MGVNHPAMPDGHLKVCVLKTSVSLNLYFPEVLIRPELRTVKMVQWSTATCVGDLRVANLGSFAVVRNAGGGSSRCCSQWPEAAGARVSNGGGDVEVQLKPGTRRTADGRSTSRNGARVYLADSCAEGDYASVSYAAVPLLGQTLSVSVDLSGVECGCNGAFYLVSMAGASKPGHCGGDFCERHAHSRITRIAT